MTTTVQLVRRHPISAFAVLACFFGWMPYIVTALGIGSNPENFPLGPVIAALLVTSCQGRQALFAWGRSLRRWAASPWLYALALGAPALLQVAIVLVNHQLGAPLPTAAQLGSWPEVPVTFLAMLVLVGLGEEAGWTAFAAPVLLRRFGLLGAFGVLAPLRIFWHLPLMLTGDMPLVVLLMLRHRRGSWTLAAVWHAVLNAFGNAFFFSMVSGADRDRLNLLLGLEYAVLGLIALAAFTSVARRRDEGLDVDGDREPTTAEVPSETPWSSFERR